VTIAVEVSYVMLVHPSVPAKTVQDLIALARVIRESGVKAE